MDDSLPPPGEIKRMDSEEVSDDEKANKSPPLKVGKSVVDGLAESLFDKRVDAELSDIKAFEEQKKRWFDDLSKQMSELQGEKAVLEKEKKQWSEERKLEEKRWAEDMAQLAREKKLMQEEKAGHSASKSKQGHSSTEKTGRTQALKNTIADLEAQNETLAAELAQMKTMWASEEERLREEHALALEVMRTCKACGAVNALPRGLSGLPSSLNASSLNASHEEAAGALEQTQRDLAAALEQTQRDLAMTRSELEHTRQQQHQQQQQQHGDATHEAKQDAKEEGARERAREESLSKVVEATQLEVKELRLELHRQQQRLTDAQAQLQEREGELERAVAEGERMRGLVERLEEEAEGRRREREEEDKGERGEEGEKGEKGEGEGKGGEGVKGSLAQGEVSRSRVEDAGEMSRRLEAALLELKDTQHRLQGEMEGREEERAVVELMQRREQAARRDLHALRAEAAREEREKRRAQESIGDLRRLLEERDEEERAQGGVPTGAQGSEEWEREKSRLDREHVTALLALKAQQEAQRNDDLEHFRTVLAEEKEKMRVLEDAWKGLLAGTHDAKITCSTQRLSTGRELLHVSSAIVRENGQGATSRNSMPRDPATLSLIQKLRLTGRMDALHHAPYQPSPELASASLAASERVSSSPSFLPPRPSSSASPPRPSTSAASSSALPLRPATFPSSSSAFPPSSSSSSSLGKPRPERPSWFSSASLAR